MSLSVFECCNPQRRKAVVNHPTRNGVDFLEVDGATQTHLTLHFIKPVTDAQLNDTAISITGGERIQNIAVVGTPQLDPADSTIVNVKVSEPGDFSTYTLLIRQKTDPEKNPEWLDPQLSSIEFSFKVECPTDFDCRDEQVCPPEARNEPEIDYLAKDYASFRQLMLDRLSVVAPDWQERNPADLGITLVELLAYVGDYLSYQQDAIATEAYLGTARRRSSVRRHARLVDYSMHNGCNSRAWIQVRVKQDVPLLPQFTPVITVSPDSADPVLSSVQYETNLDFVLTFETMENVSLFSAHNVIQFYTWGAQNCCLPKGAVRASLLGKFPDLKKGMVLVLQEVKGSQTGQPEDANPNNRQAVRLKKDAVVTVDPLGGQFLPEPNNDPVDITEIEWEEADALTFPLCIDTDKASQVSCALGNIVLADHGRTVREEPVLGDYGRTLQDSAYDNVVPPSTLLLAGSNRNHCDDQAPKPVPPRFRPRLRQGPLTHAAPYDPTRPVYNAENWQSEKALPSVVLYSQLSAEVDKWEPRPDLLKSGRGSREFVVEVENDGRAYLRFGDDINGRRPATGSAFTATYRVGNGLAGNVGANSLVQLVSDDLTLKSRVLLVTNPLPAVGGVEPEDLEKVRQNAPAAFRRQERAVTPDDYAMVAQRFVGVQRAAATFRWTGSWRTVFLTVDRLGGRTIDNNFKGDLADFMERYRMAGYDLEVNAPEFVSLELELLVCVKSGYFRSQVKAALLEVLSNRVLPDGRRGLFHPDNFTFGQPVYLSPIYAAAQSVEGVSYVEVKKFQPQGFDTSKWLNLGQFDLGRLQIARLDNDPNFPEHGILKLTMQGGK